MFISRSTTECPTFPVPFVGTIGKLAKTDQIGASLSFVIKLTATFVEPEVPSVLRGDPGDQQPPGRIGPVPSARRDRDLPFRRQRGGHGAAAACTRTGAAAGRRVAPRRRTARTRYCGLTVQGSGL